MLKSDETRRKLRRRFVQARCQARFRGEQWLITFEDYFELFMQKPEYLQSGTQKHSYNLCRKDITDDWTINNVHIITRQQHNRDLMLEKNRAYRR